MSWISEFLASFGLFGAQYVSGWLAAALLSLCGVLVVARRQVFLGAAAAQSATLGCALALAVSGSELVASTFAVAFAAGMALLVASAPPERTAVAFLAAASLSILVVAQSPHGTEEVHRIVASSSLLGATWSDAFQLAALLAVVATLALRHGRALVLIAIDPETAQASGLRAVLALRLVAVVTGLAIGLGLRCTGLLYAFGLVVLPPLVASRLARRTLPLLWLAPAVGVAAAVVAFVLAHHFDLPPGQLTVVLLCGALGGASLLGRAR